MAVNEPEEEGMPEYPDDAWAEEYFAWVADNEFNERMDEANE